MNFQDVWSYIDNSQVEEPEQTQKVLQIHKLVFFSTVYKFQHAKRLIQECSLEDFEAALWDIDTMEPMEVSVEEMTDELRYYLYKNKFREVHQIESFKSQAWNARKEKKRKFV